MDSGMTALFGCMSEASGAPASRRLIARSHRTGEYVSGAHSVTKTLHSQALEQPRDDQVMKIRV